MRLWTTGQVPTLRKVLAERWISTTSSPESIRKKKNVTRNGAIFRSAHGGVGLGPAVDEEFFGIRIGRSSDSDDSIFLEKMRMVMHTGVCRPADSCGRLKKDGTGA